VAPRTPLVVKSGGVEVLRLSTLLNAADVEKTGASTQGRRLPRRAGCDHELRRQPVPAGASRGSSGSGRRRAHPEGGPGHSSLAVRILDVYLAPPGDSVTANKQTPFVWAEEHYR
jgi:hypothetical protein